MPPLFSPLPATSLPSLFSSAPSPVATGRGTRTCFQDWHSGLFERNLRTGGGSRITRPGFLVAASAPLSFFATLLHSLSLLALSACSSGLCASIVSRVSRAGSCLSIIWPLPCFAAFFSRSPTPLSCRLTTWLLMRVPSLRLASDLGRFRWFFFLCACLLSVAVRSFCLFRLCIFFVRLVSRTCLGLISGPSFHSCVQHSVSDGLSFAISRLIVSFLCATFCFRLLGSHLRSIVSFLCATCCLILHLLCPISVVTPAIAFGRLPVSSSSRTMPLGICAIVHPGACIPLSACF